MGAAAFRAAAAAAAAAALGCAACTSMAVDARSFEGSRWQVAAVNGRATPASGDYHVEFRDGRIGGRFGCNSWGGRYTVAGGLLRASDIVSTLMGCPEPAASFEREGLAILQQPMRWTWASGTHLTLANSAGSIVLDRAG